VGAAGVAKPAHVYDLPSTFVSDALAAGSTVFETARIAGRLERLDAAAR